MKKKQTYPEKWMDREHTLNITMKFDDLRYSILNKSDAHLCYLRNHSASFFSNSKSSKKSVNITSFRIDK